MQRLELKPTHKPVQNYYSALRQQVGLEFFNHENTIRVNRQKQTLIFVVQGKRKALPCAPRVRTVEGVVRGIRSRLPGNPLPMPLLSC